MVNRDVMTICILLMLTASALAESVSVKYRGCVPLDTFQCATIYRSSLVERVTHFESFIMDLSKLTAPLNLLGRLLLAALFLYDGWVPASASKLVLSDCVMLMPLRMEILVPNRMASQILLFW